jgi:hypothetical protein
MSKTARQKIAQLIFDAMREKVEGDKQLVKTSKKLGRGRPQGDAYKRGAELLGMSKTNFYNLVNSAYATSDVTAEKIFRESYKLRPQQAMNLLIEDQVSANRRWNGQIRNLITKESENHSSSSLKLICEDTKDIIQYINGNLNVLYRAIFQEWSHRFSRSKASRSSIIETEDLTGIKEIPFTLEDLQKPIRDLNVIMKQIDYLLKAEPVTNK